MMGRHPDNKFPGHRFGGRSNPLPRRGAGGPPGLPPGMAVPPGSHPGQIIIPQLAGKEPLLCPACGKCAWERFMGKKLLASSVPNAEGKVDVQIVEDPRPVPPQETVFSYICAFCGKWYGVQELGDIARKQFAVEPQEDAAPDAARPQGGEGEKDETS